VSKVLAVVLASLVLAPATVALAASPSGPGNATASVAVSSARAGARPVALTVSLRTELQCGRLRGPSVALRLPPQARVPRTIGPSAVLVGGSAAAAVRVTGNTLSINLPRPTGMMCDSITMGVARIVVTRAANVGNPSAPGRYRVSVLQGATAATAPLAISR
jgi:hypothetical protein